MKATLEFTDGFEFRCAVNGRLMHGLLWNLAQEMRDDIKYHSGLQNTDHWQRRLWTLIEHYGINLDDDYEF